MDYLLQSLKEEGVSVPSSVYMLNKMRSSSKVDVLCSVLKCGGQMAYLSIQDNLIFCIKNNLLLFEEKFNKLSLSINIDGLPLFRSSPVCLWPILFSFRNFSFKKPLPIAVYAGTGKPDFSGFLDQLCSELEKFSNFVNIDGVFIKIEKLVFICDSPARSFLQSVKSHSGYNACCFCRIRGEHNGSKVIFPFSEEPIAQRSDDLYKICQENNQLSLSPLAKYSSLKCAFPFEYMHLVCLGIVKRLIQSFLTTNFGLLPCKLSENMKSLLNEKVKNLRGALPKEFRRGLRPFSQHAYFKASEFRSILLYTGPVLFSEVLPVNYYNHFMYLHFSISVLCNSNYSYLYPQVRAVIREFLRDMGHLYTTSAYTYNAHCLSHLVDFVEIYGPLDSFSSFPFENYLHVLKQRIKSGSFVLSQSITAIQNIREIYVTTRSKELFFSCKYPDNCAVILYNGSLKYILIDCIDSNCIF